MKYPEYMIDFIELFWTEEQCLSYLEEIRRNWECPKCWEKKYYRTKWRRVRICAWCWSTLCVTAWTSLHRMRIQIRNLFLMWWFFVTSKQWVSWQELSSILWIDEKTTWLWIQKFRKVMVLEWRKKLSWDVEVDEVFVWGKQSWIRARWAKWKAKVVIAVEINMEKQNKKWLYRWMWRVRMKVIPNCWEKTLRSFIENNVEKWSTLYTDWWLWYKNIDKFWYRHIIEKSLVEDDEINWIYEQEVTPNVHIIASLLKRWLLGTHQWYQVRWGYLQEYLEEYTFRFNRRKSSNRWKIFKTLITQILAQPPITREQIKKASKKE